MPLFFLISGFLHKQRSFKDELKVTIKSLIIPYFILTFVFLAIHLDLNYKDYLYTSLCSLEQTPYYIMKDLYQSKYYERVEKLEKMARHGSDVNTVDYSSGGDDASVAYISFGNEEK